MIGSILLLASCTDVEEVLLDLNAGLPDGIYDPAPLYDGDRVNSVGTLTEAYIQNTEGLMIVNSRLQTLCLAHRVCEAPTEPEH